MAVYKEYFTGSNSAVWKHFLRDEKGETAMCKVSDCKKVLKIGGGTTRGLHTHLFSIHKIQLKNKKDSDVASTEGEPLKKRVTKLTNFFPALERKQKSLPAPLSRLTALDGVSFNVLCHSMDLRAALTAMGFEKLPSSPSTICKIVLDYANEIRNSVKAEIAIQRKSGERFSLSFDEWTSLRNRRYMNINVHAEESKFWSLGLVRISGTMPAEKCIELLVEKLNEHGLNLHKDIISIMTDGTSVMTKVEKLLSVHQQLCLAHGIQLSVIDVLYKKSDERAESEKDTLVDNLSESETEPEICEELEYDGAELVDRTCLPPCEVNDSSFGPLIKKVRRIVSLFKRSPTKNDDLQKYVREDFGKEIPLVKDCKTRWSSLLAMLERFYLLRNCVQKALIDVKLNISIDISQNEIQAISEIFGALTPIKATVEALCRQDANLITADIAISFTLKKLEDADYIISQMLFTALTIRLKQRRTDLSGLLYYLHNGLNGISHSDKEFIIVPTPTKCRKLIVDLLERLNATSITGCSTIVTEVDEDVSVLEEIAEVISVQPLTTAEEINKAINDDMSRSRPQVIPNRCESLVSKLQKEMALFENGGSHGDYLKRAYTYLKTIKPTSESERAFSSAGLFCNKLLSSLGDKVLDELCFLRCHFQQQKRLNQEF